MLQFLLLSFFGSILAHDYKTYGKALRDQLKDKYRAHTNRGYSGIRVEMYGFCFNDPERNSVIGIYTGQSLAYKYGSTSTSQNSELNCEHLVPQSFFNKLEPMRADAHHLRPANATANNARSNYPFAEVEPSNCKKWFIDNKIYTTTPKGDLNEYSCLSASKTFYPRAAARGNVARAVAYFFTVYPEYISQFNKTIVDADLMVKWHEANPVTDDEISQHDCIVEVQDKGGNPYIIDMDPSLMRRAYCDMLSTGCSEYA